MTVRRDPMRRVILGLIFVCGNVLLDLDFVWNLGHSATAWLIRIAFNGLLLCDLVLARGEIDMLSLDEKVLARAVGRGWGMMGVAVLFSDTRVVAVRRSMWLSTRSIGEVLVEAPRSAVHLYHRRHGAIFDHVRCDWDGGREMHLRFRAGELNRVRASVDPQVTPSIGLVARAVDWVRAGTTYEA